jgi:hypothetical protein
LDILFERLHTEPKWQRAKVFYGAGVKGVKKAGTYVRKQPVTAKIAVVIVISVTAGGIYAVTHQHNNQAINQVAGANTNQSDQKPVSPSDLSREAPKFALLLPKGRLYAGIETVLVSPEGNDPVYAFADNYEGSSLTVSQQLIPKTFDYNRQAELERVAKEFQVNDVIQVDASKIYHGISSKTKEQSLIFIKEDRLVFIKSSVQLKDDLWANYYLGLSKKQ